jgi:non-specific serine/threonine protein kinase
VCGRTFQDTTSVCPTDGTALGAPDPLLGSLLEGKYRIDALVSYGGMGAVYRGTQVHLERTVAIKVVRAEHLGDASSVERFEREARTIARVHHPHIVIIHDFGFAPGVGAYLVMEYLQGHSLRQELQQRGSLPPAKAVDLLRQVCSAVHAAHVAGVIHRDLKPDNVFLEDSAHGPAVKVLDFGIAKLQDASGQPVGNTTTAGTFIGTPSYMSPEQCLGEPIDARSDIYALGCVLYEMLAGRPPFVAPSAAAVLRKHVAESPAPIRRYAPEVPAHCEAALERALAKRATDRFSSALELAAALAGPSWMAPTQTVIAEEARAPDSMVTRSEWHVGERPTRTSAAHRKVPNNLPQQVTSFVGRRAELDRLKVLLGEARLVTLTGPGGIGKTRLAVKLAMSVLENFPGGVWLVELAAVSDPELIGETIAAALGIRPDAGGTLTVTIAGRLGTAPTLLMLDNCEHLIEACAALIERLLRACPALRIVATSQEVVGIVGEAVCRVPTLGVPGTKQRGSLEELSRSEAVELFCERARLCKTGFELTALNAPAIAALCQRLDGIPLAIELAAARIKVLSPEQILERLDDRFRLLTGGSRTVLPRQQTLRATMEWSYSLLTEAERVLLRRLSVFAGGFTLEAAEAVVADAPGGADIAEDVLDLLSRLVDKSLVLVDESELGVRYRLLDTIRQYGSEKLEEAGEAADLRSRHSEWYLRFAEHGRGAVRRPDEGAWLRRLEAEHDNFRGALRWLREQPGGAGGAIMRLCAALGRFWEIRGHWSEGRRWLAAALETAGDQLPPLRAEAYFWAGCLAQQQGDFERACELLRESLAIRREAGDAPAIAQTLNRLGNALHWQGEYAEGAAHQREALEMFRSIGQLDGVATALSGLGLSAMDAGDAAEAEALFTESLALFRQVGNDRGASVVLHNLAEVALSRHDLDTATELLDESLAIAEALDDKHIIAYSTNVLGAVSTARGDLARAAELHRDALVRTRELGDKAGLAYVIEGFACLAAARADARQALILAGAATALRDAIGAKQSPAERHALDVTLAEARNALGPEESAALFEEGRGLTLAQAVNKIEGS